MNIKTDRLSMFFNDLNHPERLSEIPDYSYVCIARIMI